MKKVRFLLLTLCLVLLCFSSCSIFGREVNSGDGDNHTEHTFEYIAYESGHFKQFTCGCPSPEIMEVHSDSDGDNTCDKCGYAVGVEIK